MRIISGLHKGRVLKTVQGAGYRPAMGKVRESLFSMLDARGLLPEGRVLDLYAASGSLGFECLSRHAQHCTFVELDKKACTAIAQNAEMLKINAQCSIVQEDVNKYLSQKKLGQFAAIFVDPPYRENKVLPTLNAILKNNFLEDEGILVVELEKECKIDPGSFELELISDKLYGQTRIIVWKNEK